VNAIQILDRKTGCETSKQDQEKNALDFFFSLFSYFRSFI